MLTDKDDFLREPGTEGNWNESRYTDFTDPSTGVSGWLRTGSRVNAGYAELSVCLYLPDGSVAVRFDKVKIAANEERVGGLRWEILAPFVRSRVGFSGTLFLLRDPLSLTDPKRAFADAPTLECKIDLIVDGDGLASVYGRDQAQIARIFLPGQAQGHYQHLVRSTGEVRLGTQSWKIVGLGCRDHSWGPRNWLSKTCFRWLVATFDDWGFMATRGIGQGTERCGGFIWHEGRQVEIDDFDLESDWNEAGYLEECRATLRGGGRQWHVVGKPVVSLPLRHRQHAPDGSVSTLRIAKSPVHWRRADGAEGIGSTEYHDIMVDGERVWRAF
ncbi:hypothetical protein [Sphingobium sp. LB126]|uniref:DUF7064 domain-containing protein n=1 Tax=Sphingobium sp. LB126 TaxID=1983755 RepID=UPI000C1FE3B5|nr:hypothetical protein [Sphingobium sp. LB126]